MALSLTQKIIQSHLVEGELLKGSPISIRIDQTLTQDATGTMAYLQFEALDLDRVRTELSVSYVDHNTLQSGFENADDHQFLQSVAAKYGLYFSRPGNGICHQVHLERFGIPGKTLLGSDSHTPTGGGIGMLAIGAGGLDVALAMAGRPFFLTMPKVVNIHLTGHLNPFVSAKDVILEVLRHLSVKGGVGKVMEYTGEGVETLSVPERATITNMGAELGATTSVFPSDEQTRFFLKSQNREGQWVEMVADVGAKYDEVIEINLSELEPLIAQPHMPDNVVKVKDLKGTKVQQVAMGSCTNSSYRDLMMVAGMLKGRKIHPAVTAGLAPGSRQVVLSLIQNGEWEHIISAGVRILENVCGPCIGMGFSPPTEAITLRTFNRNFLGRSGTKSASVYLCSPETAVAAALTGEITDPRELDIPKTTVRMPEQFPIDDSMIIPPVKKGRDVKIIRGPNIQPLPVQKPLPNRIAGLVLLKTEDNITTDHIMPAGAKILPLRSNIPAIAEHVFEVVDPTFAARAKRAGGGFIVGGSNYGQGSSREHAALAPMYLGIKAVITKSFARIHLANLINFGIIPFTFVHESDYDRMDQGDELEIDVTQIEKTPLILKNKTKGIDIPLTHPLSIRDIDLIKAGGSLAYAKQQLAR
ncbi:aconitate hydratase [bacterium]|nr:aconitate hydratase [bacterium]RQV94310.1 MAG: aconitate hydratase [bacterium]